MIIIDFSEAVRRNAGGHSHFRNTCKENGIYNRIAKLQRCLEKEDYERAGQDGIEIRRRRSELIFELLTTKILH